MIECDYSVSVITAKQTRVPQEPPFCCYSGWRSQQVRSFQAADQLLLDRKMILIQFLQVYLGLNAELYINIEAY